MQEGPSVIDTKLQSETIGNQEILSDLRQSAESGKEETKKSKPSSIQTKEYTKVDESGKLKPENSMQMFAFAEAILKAGFAPKGYDSAAKIVVGMQFAKELGLEAVSGLRNIAVINGVPSIFGELPLKLAYQTREIKFIDEYVIDAEYNKICLANKNLSAKPWAGVCVLQRNELPKVEATFTMDEAERAGLLDKRGPWNTYPKIMLMRRARSQALKTAFPDAIGGAPIAEYDFNYIPTSDEPRDVTRQGVEITSGADKLNQLLDSPADKGNA
jgi:hypothetical protein